MPEIIPDLHPLLVYFTVVLIVISFLILKVCKMRSNLILKTFLSTILLFQTQQLFAAHSFDITNGMPHHINGKEVFSNSFQTLPIGENDNGYQFTFSAHNGGKLVDYLQSADGQYILQENDLTLDNSTLEHYGYIKVVNDEGGAHIYANGFRLNDVPTFFGISPSREQVLGNNLIKTLTDKFPVDN